MLKFLTSEPETTPQLARRWGVTRARVHQIIQAGAIPLAIRAGRDWLVYDRPDLEKCNQAIKEKRNVEKAHQVW